MSYGRGRKDLHDQVGSTKAVASFDHLHVADDKQIRLYHGILVTVQLDIAGEEDDAAASRMFLFTCFKLYKEFSDNNLVRHGRTLFNQKKVWQGWCDAPLLKKEGEELSYALGTGLRDVPFAAVYSSPYRQQYPMYH